MSDIDGRDTHLGSEIQRILGENIPFILRTQVWNGKLAHDLYTYMRETLEKHNAIRAGLEKATALRCLIPGDPSALGGSIDRLGAATVLASIWPEAHTALRTIVPATRLKRSVLLVRSAECRV